MELTSGDADFPFASVFVEYAKTMNKDLDLVFGLDYVPFKAEIESLSFADTDISTAAATVTSTPKAGTRKAKLELENYATLYLQPTFKVGGGTATLWQSWIHSWRCKNFWI